MQFSCGYRFNEVATLHVLIDFALRQIALQENRVEVNCFLLVKLFSGDGNCNKMFSVENILNSIKKKTRKYQLKIVQKLSERS